MKKISPVLIVLMAIFATSCEPIPPIVGTETGNKAPVCYFSNPSNGSAHYSTNEVKLQVEAFDKDGEITSVEFYIDNGLYMTLNDAPYELTLPPDYFTDGQHVLKAIAKDNDNGTKAATISIHIVQGGGESTIFTLGSLYNKNGLKGIIYKLNEESTSGMIVSLNDTLCNWIRSEYAYLTVGASDVNNGASNLSKILESGQIRKHPAFNWCNKKNANNTTGWYLPAKNQVRDIYNSLEKISDSMTYYGVPFFKPEHENDTIYYWTSTEVNDEDSLSNAAWSVNFKNGNCSNPNKHWHAYVRAVHPF
jgi:hypothetical protein